jgi:hypothetical protein
MAYLIDHFGSGILGSIFEGSVDMPERLKAIDALDKAIAVTDPKAILIDLSAANLAHYGASDALSLAARINQRERPFRKVAYVLRPHQTDMVAMVMSGIHGPDTFRRFSNREDAIAWLKQAA